MKAYRDTGFDGPMVEDHVPEMAGGPDQWPAKAFALGYGPLCRRRTRVEPRYGWRVRREGNNAVSD